MCNSLVCLCSLHMHCIMYKHTNMYAFTQPHIRTPAQVADILGKTLNLVASRDALRSEFVEPFHSAFSAARANAWMLLQLVNKVRPGSICMHPHYPIKLQREHL